MNVNLIDYTGAGSPDPARHAANVLAFTKATRLEMNPGLMNEIQAKPWAEILEQLQYMANTIPSSWEFVEYKFLINGVTRAFTHQFVRTRTASFAQQTMRVLNVEGWNYGMGPTITNDNKRHADYARCMERIGTCYDQLIGDGAAIEDARGVLPTNILTNIVAKFDLRAFVATVRKRSSSRVQGEYRDVLDAMKAEVLRVHPWASLFIERDQDKVANELDARIRSLGLDKASTTDLVKMIDQLRSAE